MVSRSRHVITVGEDITEWKAAIDRTAQSEKLAALGQLAAGVMHEINNPLATIAACGESLALHREMASELPPGTPVPGADPAEMLRIIDLEVQRCKRIVNGLLDFARPKAGSARDRWTSTPWCSRGCSCCSIIRATSA